MNTTALITSVGKQELPILIIDKKGILGEKLANELSSESLIVLISNNISKQEENILHIPFIKKMPTIPDNKYSHIFLIDEDLEVARKLAKHLIKKAKNDNSYFIFCVDVNSAAKTIVDKIITSYENISVVVIGDIFLQNDIYNFKTNINKFIYQIKTEGKINVPDDGGEETRPVFIDDVVNGILETAFSQDKKNKIFYLFPKHKITLLMLAHMFQKSNPDIKIGFINSKKTKLKDTFFSKEEGKYLLSENYSVWEKIKKINFSNLEIKNVTKKNKSTRKKIFSLNFSLVVTFLVSFLLLPLVAAFIFGLVGTSFLHLAKTSFGNDNYLGAKYLASFSSENFVIAKKSIELLEVETSFLKLGKQLQEIKKNIDLGIDTSLGISSFANAIEKYINILNGVSINPQSDFLEAQTEFKDFLYTFNKEKNLSFFSKQQKNKLIDAIDISSATIDYWPDLLGFNGKKTYVILFQDNMELRPGGGVIEFYGTLTLENGSVSSFRIHNVDDVQSSVMSDANTPFPIRRFIPSKNWYLKDSSFNLDFSKGAIIIANFLSSKTQQKIDGVIGIDLYFIKNILSVTGPVYISEYKETINKDNLYKLIQNHKEKDFLLSIYNSLFKALKIEKNISDIDLINAITASIKEKHLLIFLNNTSAQTAFSLNGLSSSLLDERAKNKVEVNDFMGLSEASINGNKVNAYVTRNISQSVIIKSDGKISENLTMNIKNNSNDLIYRNYLRIVLPKDALLDTITIDGVKQKLVDVIDNPLVYEKKNFKAPQGLEIKKEELEQNTAYGFLVSVDADSIKTINFFYTLKDKFVFSKPELSYNLKLFKQPGIDIIPYEFSINIPQELKLVDVSKRVKLNGYNAHFSTQISRDMEIKLRLAPK